MGLVLQHVALTAPLFALVLAGWAAVRWLRVPARAAKLVHGVAFYVLIPALLFDLMTGLATLRSIDAGVLGAFFGGCLVVFAVGRALGRAAFHLDGAEQSVFALGGVFSNNVLLGVPIATAALGPDAMPSIALVLVFNALILWTLVTVSVEWARHGAVSVPGFGRTVLRVLVNPVVASILAGSIWGALGLPIATAAKGTLGVLAKGAGPFALVSLGLSLGDYHLRAALAPSLAITALKLVAQPLAVWLLARAFGLDPIETRAVAFLAVLPVGVNVYMMAKQFGVMEEAVASSLMISTIAAALTTPLFLALTS
ncbi:AEC family transporter [Myxococcota bacterium]|nr:AEC family transporter [Myxococcota bacterium]